MTNKEQGQEQSLAQNQKISLNLSFELMKEIPSFLKTNKKNESKIKYFEILKEEVLKIFSEDNWNEKLTIFLENEIENFNFVDFEKDKKETVDNDKKIICYFLHRLLFTLKNNIKDVHLNKISLDELKQLLNQTQEQGMEVFNNEFYDYSLTNIKNDELMLKDSINKHIILLKNEYGIKDVIFSSNISQINLLKNLMSFKTTLDEIVLDLELENGIYLGLKDKYLCIDFYNTNRAMDHFKGCDFIHINKKANKDFVKIYASIFIEKIKRHKNGSLFVERFWDHFLKNDNNDFDLENLKFNYIQLYSEYLYDSKEIILSFDNKDKNKHKHNFNKEMEFIESLLTNLNGFLDMREAIELNKDKNIYFYHKWREDFLKSINEYNTKRLLDSNIVLKKEVFKLAFLFKYIILNNYQLSFWKDVYILMKLTDLSFEFFTDKEIDFLNIETFIFNVMRNKKLLNQYLKESKKHIIEDLIERSFIGFINYYREQKNIIDKTTMPYLYFEAEKEKDFWEENIEDIVTIINDDE